MGSAPLLSITATTSLVLGLTSVIVSLAAVPVRTASQRNLIRK
jgi:hypothetical protein